MTKTQASDPQIRALQSSPSSTLVVEAVPLANSSNPLYCDTSTGTQCPLVPLPWRRTVFDSLHGLSHPGIRATQKLITARFVWPGINADVRRWTRSCVRCQRAKIQRHTNTPRAKIQRHTTTPLSSFPIPDARFDVIYIDLVDRLKSAHLDHDHPQTIPQTAPPTNTPCRTTRSGRRGCSLLLFN